jgi:hypothetical protein
MPTQVSCSIDPAEIAVRAVIVLPDLSLSGLKGGEAYR